MKKQQQAKNFILEETNLVKIEEFLSNNKTLNLKRFSYPNRSNILHHLAYDGKQSILSLYISHQKNLIWNQQNQNSVERKTVKDQMSLWINEKNQQGYTPILYAALNGHVNTIDILIQNGASITCRNITGSGILHLAAQNNKVSTLVYFKQKGLLGFGQPDQNGITPLHWACCSGSQQAASFLLTIPEIDINKKDSEGQTPLILATVYGNTKIVRRLLVKGAKRNIKNNQGKKAIDIAQQNQFTNIKKMLDVDYNCFDFLQFYYNVKVQYTQKKRSFQIPVVFVLTAICCILIINGLICFTPNLFYALESSTFGLMFILYFSLILSPNKQQKGILMPEDVENVCFECCRKKKQRSYHCDICGICISQYDHHCTWINNCVGKRNITRFILFIFILLISLFTIAYTSISALIKIYFDQSIEWFSFRGSFQQSWQKISMTVLLSLNVGISFFFFPVFLLFYVQVKNLLYNRTTYESARGRSEIEDKPSLGNCVIMCKQEKSSFATARSLDDQLLSH